MVIPQDTRGSKRFYWDLVLNNYSLEECESVKVVFEEIADAYIIGKEIGSVNGTPHLQMMIKLKKGNYKSYLIKKLGKRVSIREGRNINAMREYCMKDGDIYASKNVDKIKLVKKLPVEERVEEFIGAEKFTREALYNKFIEEADKNMDGYEWLKEYLLKNIDKKDYYKMKDNGYEDVE